MKKLVVFVDDDSTLLGVIREIVINEDYKSIFFEIPQKAYRYCLKNRVDLVVTDYNMPRLSGWGLIKKLENKKIKSILMTGDIGSVEDTSIFTKVINKPFLVSSFLETIRETLEV